MEEKETVTPIMPETKKRKVLPPVPMMTVDEYLKTINESVNTPSFMSGKMPAKVRMMLEAGYTRFSARHWSNITQCNIKQADYDCRSLYWRGLVGRERKNNHFVYSFRVIKGEEETLVQDNERLGSLV